MRLDGSRHQMISMRTVARFPGRPALHGFAALGLLLPLTACETVSTARDPGVAVVNSTDPAAISANMTSRSAVIARNPNDAQAYNTRGAAYAKAGRFSE